MIMFVIVVMVILEMIVSICIVIDINVEMVLFVLLESWIMCVYVF